MGLFVAEDSPSQVSLSIGVRWHMKEGLTARRPGEEMALLFHPRPAPGTTWGFGIRVFAVALCPS